MRPASPEAICASLRAMGYDARHADRLLADRPLVSVSPVQAAVATAQGPRVIPLRPRTGPIALPAPSCAWSASNKALVVEAIVTGQIAIEAAAERYSVPREAVAAWIEDAVNAGRHHSYAKRQRAA